MHNFIIYYSICFPLFVHILYFDAAKFSIKQFLLLYFTVSIVSKRNEYEIVTECDPLKSLDADGRIILWPPFQDVNLHKNPDNGLMKSNTHNR